MLTLLAAGAAATVVSMTAVWVWQRRVGNAAVSDGAWPLLVGGLAVFDAVAGSGAPFRRSAIGWMMGSWGARLGVQILWDGVLGRPERARYRVLRARWGRKAGRRFFWLFQLHGAAALLCSIPALVASVNPQPALSTIELTAAVLWMLAFAGETTADRQRRRFERDPANQGRACDRGVWRYSRRAHEVFDTLVWVALALFAAPSPHGWIACPVAMGYLFAGWAGEAYSQAS